MQVAPDYAEHREQVRPEWTDGSGALAPAYAVVIFDHAIDRLYEGIGLGPDYRRASANSTFTLETHLLQERPVGTGDEVVVRSAILGVDAKRMHIAQEMFRAGEPARAALMEQLAIHVDLTHRRSAPFPPERLGEIRTGMAALAAWPPPSGTGRRVGLSD